MSYMMHIIHADQSIRTVDVDSLERYISREKLYAMYDRWDQHDPNRSRGVPRLPTYEALIQNLKDCWVDGKTPYYETKPVLLMDSEGNFAPVLWVRDEQVHDQHVRIPVLFMDQYSADVPKMWNANIDLGLWGLDYQPEGGIRNPLVSTEQDFTKLRWWRYFRKLVKNITYSVTRDLLIEKLAQHTPKAIEYWESRGVHGSISKDPATLIDSYRGLGFEDMIVIEIEHHDGSTAAGFFSVLDSELYWDFTRHGPAPHIGNNVLLAGLQYARSMGRYNLNLGVGYYAWKDLWATSYATTPGITQRENSPLNLMRDSLFAMMPEPTLEGAARDRTVA